MAKGMVAKTAIKHNGKTIDEGEKVTKSDFSDDEWKALEDAAAVGQPDTEASTEEEEKEREVPAAKGDASPSK